MHVVSKPLDPFRHRHARRAVGFTCAACAWLLGIRRMSLLVNMSHSELSCPARGTVSPNPITELGSRAQAALLANTGALVGLQAKCALHERRCSEFIGKPAFVDERAGSEVRHVC